jgi:hypothetical protein
MKNSKLNWKVGLTVLSSVFFLNGAFAQGSCPTWPPCESGGSSCATAVDLTVGANCKVGSNDAVAATNETDCDGNPVFGVWYKFTTDATGGTYTVSTDNGTGVLAADHVVKLYADTCDSLIACGDENGDCNASAAQITADLAANTTYWVMVTIWNGGRGSWCVNVVKNGRPANDCISGAIDIGDLVDHDLNGCCPAAGEAYVYRAHHVNPDDDAMDSPSPSTIGGITDNHCNGNNPVTNSTFFDVWFTFTYNSATMNNRWLNVYSANDCNLYGMQLFSGTPVSTGCTGNFTDVENITGLTYVDCSAGDNAVFPTCGNTGGARDKSLGNASNHPTIDLSGLTNGTTYYVRVYRLTQLLVGSTTIIAPPSEGYINLVVEAAPVTTGGVVRSIDGRSRDVCFNAPVTVGCADATAKDVDVTYDCLTNAGLSGNINNCGGVNPNEPDVVNFAPFVGTFQQNCTGSQLTPVGPFDVNHNSAVYKFTIPTGLNAAGVQICNAKVDIDFTNIGHIGVNGAGGTFTVVTAACAPVANGILGGQTDWCNTSLCLDPTINTNNTLPPGDYYIIVDGQRDNVLTYSLRIAVDYRLVTSGLNCPLAIAPACGTVAKQISQPDYNNMVLTSVKPVPAVDQVEIAYFASKEAAVNLEIFDMFGKKVYAETITSAMGENTHNINISSLPVGTYIMTMTSNGEKVQSKLMKVE